MNPTDHLIKNVQHIMKPFERRIFNMHTRGVVERIDDSDKRQMLGVSLHADEAKDPIEHLQPYGFTAVPLTGAETLMLGMGGDKSHGVLLICTDPRYRKKGMSKGDVALYDYNGNYIHLKPATNDIEVKATGNVTIEGEQKVTLKSDTHIYLDAPLINTSCDVQICPAS